MATSKAEIDQLAYAKWERAGYPLGQDEKFWLEAQEELAACPKCRKPIRSLGYTRMATVCHDCAELLFCEDGVFRVVDGKERDECFSRNSGMLWVSYKIAQENKHGDQANQTS